MCGHPFHPGHAKTAYPGGPGFGGMAAWGFSFLVNTISKNALIAYVIHSPGEDRNYGW